MTETSSVPPPPKPKNRIWLKLLLLVAILAALALCLYETGWIHFFLSRERMARFLRDLGRWSFAGFILLQAVQVVAAPIPGEVTGFLGGYLYGPVVGIALSTVGLTIGSLIAFLLTRTFGRPIVDRFVDKNTIARFDFLLHHKGAFLVFLLFLLPGFPTDYLCYILGLGHLTIGEFLLISASGRLLGTSMLTLGGSYLRARKYFQLSLLAGAAVIVIFLALVYKDRLEQRLKDLRARHHRK